MELPKILFHVTDKKFLKSIKKEGLIPFKNPQYPSISKPKYVYMGHESTALLWGAPQSPKHDRVLIKIRTALLDKTKIAKDSNLDGYNSYQYEGEIPRKALMISKKKIENNGVDYWSTVQKT
jgi:predicted SPOUT superfamily RNA methylase MTH1